MRQTSHPYCIIALISASTCCASYAFNTPHSKALRRSYTLPSNANDRTTLLKKLSSDNDNDFNDAQFFDDFGDALLGNSMSNTNDIMMESLQSKMAQTREIEAAYDAKLERNWRKGNWSVRGFALEKERGPSQIPPINEEKASAVHVSTVAAPVSSTLSSSSLLRDETLSEDRTVAVGRTDGSVFLVQLGNEYLTKFAPSQKLVANENDEEISVRVNQEWTKQQQIEKEDERKLQPFEVLLNFQSSELGEVCHSIAFHDISEQTDNNGYICTAAGDSGVINLWVLPLNYDDPDAGQNLQSVSLTGAHQDRIVALKTIVVPSSNVDDREEQHLLISASRDGVMSLWDLNKSGKLLFSSPCVRERKLTCADVSNPSLDRSYYFSDDENGGTCRDMMFFGTSDGYVVGYNIQTVLNDGECTEPDISFRAHGVDSGKGEGITAIKCGTDQTTPTSGNDVNRAAKVTSTVLLTGGEDGLANFDTEISKWYKNGSLAETFSVENETKSLIAHLFPPGHEGPVTALSQQGQNGSATFLSCGHDGSICVWGAASGELYYRMDGFTNSVSSLACLGPDLLVTDGMDALVCVHNFSIFEDAASTGYELEW